MRRTAGDDLNLAYVVTPAVRASSHVDGNVLFHTQTGKIFVGNRTSAQIWEGIAAGDTVGAIVGRLRQQYGISQEHGMKDALSLVRDLRANGLIEPQKRSDSPRRGWSLAPLIVRAMWQLFRYDLENAVLGFGRMQKRVACEPVERASARADRNRIGHVVKAVSIASLFYGSSVKCLQRSVAVTRLLRKSGIPAEVVIGYRAAPFFSHAWVEVEGKVIHDSQVLASELAVLHRF